MTDTAVATTDQPRRREVQTVIDSVPIYDSAKFEHMQRVTNLMAKSSTIPISLRAEKEGQNWVALPPDVIYSNCFRIVNQATNWGMDPFSVVDCCSVVHGRLLYEGKLVAAVLDAKLRIKLHMHFTGDPATESLRIYLSDRPFTAEMLADLKPGYHKEGWRLWDGSVAEWKTTGGGSPWTLPKNYKRMLIYRGTRDWTRIWESALLLGVYTDDEMENLNEDARARRATVVGSSHSGLLSRAAGRGPASSGSANTDHDGETGEVHEAANTDRSVTDSSEAGSQRVDSNVVSASDAEITGQTDEGSTAETEDSAKSGESQDEGDSAQASMSSEREPDTSGSGTRNADASASSQPDLLSAASPADSQKQPASSGTAAAAGAGGPELAPAPERLRSFSKALGGIESDARKLGGMQTKWTEKFGVFEGEPEAQAKKIYALHLKRIMGELDAKACTAQVEEIIGK